MPQNPDANPALGRQVAELQIRGYSTSEISRELNLPVNKIRQILHNRRRGAELEMRLQGIEDMLGELLVLVRQLSKLPRSEVEKRTRQLELEWAGRDDRVIGISSRSGPAAPA